MMNDADFLRSCADKDYLNMNMRMQMKEVAERLDEIMKLSEQMKSKIARLEIENNNLRAGQYPKSGYCG